MRIVMVGAASLTVATARLLLERGHEVVIIEPDEVRLRELEQELDCGFLHGDGSRPSVLKETGPQNTDFLLALGNDDQTNILAALVGRELGFGAVLCRIENPEFAGICDHLGLRNTIIPDLEIGRSLADMIEAGGQVSLTARLKGGLRFLSIRVGSGQAGTVGELKLPREVRVVAVTRDERSEPATEDTPLEEGDELLLILQAKHAPDLRKRLGSADTAAGGRAGMDATGRAANGG